VLRNITCRLESRRRGRLESCGVLSSAPVSVRRHHALSILDLRATPPARITNPLRATAVDGTVNISKASLDYPLITTCPTIYACANFICNSKQDSHCQVSSQSALPPPILCYLSSLCLPLRSVFGLDTRTVRQG